MKDGTDAGPAVARPAAAIAAVGSIMAGLVHAAAGINHDGDAVLVAMFSLCAVAQILWGVSATIVIRPGRLLLLVGLLINGGALIVWALTRTIGIPFVDSLSEVETIGRQDLGAALFAGASALGAIVVLLRPERAPKLRLGSVGALAVLALVAAVPAMRSDHTHAHDDPRGAHDHLETASEHGPGEEAHGEDGHDGDGHDDHDPGDDHGHAGGDDHSDGSSRGHGADAGDHAEEGHAHGDLVSTGDHGHGGGAGPGQTHAPGPHPHPGDPDDPQPHPDDPGDPHPHPDPDDPDDPGDPHPHPDPDDPGDPHPDPDPEEPITSIDDPRLTDEQWNIAVALIISTTSGMQGFVTEADVIAAGYQSIGDGGQPGTYTHHINWSYVGDEHELDPAHVESVVTKMNADGTTRVVAAMYILTTGTSTTDAPVLAGELTTWHDHDNLCFSDGQFVGLAVAGACSVGILADTPPMLHVWIEANPCGPFAPIDEQGMDCGAVHEH